MADRREAARKRQGYLRGALTPKATQRQMDAFAAYVAAGGSVHDAAELVGIQPSTVKRHLADLRSRRGLTTEQLNDGVVLILLEAVTLENGLIDDVMHGRHTRTL